MMHRHRTPTGHPSRTRALTTAVCSLATAALLALPAVSSADGCPNAIFRNGPSSRLPDCRAYEMVTPPYKEGFPVINDLPDEEGSRMWGESLGAFAGTEGDLVVASYLNSGSQVSAATAGAAYIFSRAESAWSTTAVSLPTSQFARSNTLKFSSDLTSSLWLASTYAQEEARELAGAERGQEDLSVRSSNGPVLQIGSVLPPSASPTNNDEFFQFDEASSDLSNVLFSLDEKYWNGDETHTGAESLYEYVGTGNTAPQLVGVSGGAGSTSLIGRCGTDLGSLSHHGSDAYGSGRGAVSSSGAVVYFTALACGGSPPVSELFARVDSGQPDVHTVAISEPSKEDCSACDTEAGVLASAQFVAGSTDGSKAFFTTKQPLSGGDASNNLYEYDFDSQAGRRIVRISGGDSTVLNPTADVESSVGNAGDRGSVIVSDDGSHVYFVASGVLTETPNSLGQKAQAARSNLYLYERDVQYPNGRVAFVVPFADVLTLENGHNTLTDASQNGRFLTFASDARLTPDTLGPATQVFEYDSQTGAFVRVSIGQNGFNDNGNIGAVSGGFLTANNGAVFFNSESPLVPQAVSGQENVYEYREGNVYLISDGQDPEGAGLDSISPSGGDVFFSTKDRLVPRDTDSQEDTYDARVDGGFPEPPSPVACQGDACQGSLSGAPVLLSPSSAFQAGGENVVSGSAGTSGTSSKAKGKSKAKGQGKAKRSRRRRRAKRAGRRAGGIGGRL